MRENVPRTHIEAQTYILTVLRIKTNLTEDLKTGHALDLHASQICMHCIDLQRGIGR